jgi:voltage-gated potassium channel
MAGIILTYKKPRLMRFLIGLVALNVLILFSDTVNYNLGINIKVVKLVSYFIFYGIVTFEIIQQVANARMVEKNVIIGLICGYLALGLLSFFLFFVIELVEPNSFSSIVFQEVGDNELPTQRLLYFSFVTLLTIGYGEVVPVSEIAQKAAILVALIGQFYIVILMAIVVGKYINQFQHDS